jgi:hypothetical protein
MSKDNKNKTGDAENDRSSSNSSNIVSKNIKEEMNDFEAKMWSSEAPRGDQTRSEE